MSKPNSASGSCLCGDIKISTDSLNKNIGACHCSFCRKWGSGPLLALDCSDDVSIEGNKSLGIFNSSEWAERGFCKNCGTHLFYRLKEPSKYIVSAGIFEDQDLVFDHQIFIDQKPKYYSFSEKTHNLTGEEVFASFGEKP